MISSYKQLKEYIAADESRYNIRHPKILGRLLNDEAYYVLRYLKVLRYLELYTNKKKRYWEYPLFVYYLIKHRQLSYKYRIHIEPNSLGKGVYIPHFQGGIFVCRCKVGDYCTISSGVVIGTKTGQKKTAVIGNNVEITLGVKIIGDVTIGDNVIIAPNSVVVKNIDANTIVSGIPAKFLKINQLDNENTIHIRSSR